MNEQRQQAGSNSRHRALKWIGGVLLALIVLSAIGAHQKSPSSPNQSILASASIHPNFTVTTHSSVTVIQAGFVRQPYDKFFGAENITYGLVLKNRSTKLAAIGVQVTVNFIDSKGTKMGVIFPVTLTGIPANGNFYFTGSALSSIDKQPDTMTIDIVIDRSSSAHFVLPAVENLRIAGAVLPTVTGVFNNPYGSQSGQWTAGGAGGAGTLYIVYFDSRGKIIGGNTEYMGNYETPQPGAVDHFTISTAPPSSAVRAEASIDPCSEVLGNLSPNCVAYQ